MINKYLIDAYDEYQENKTYNILIEFAEKTFKNQGKQKLFIGCALILITNVTSKYYATTHALLSILAQTFEKTHKNRQIRNVIPNLSKMVLLNN